MQHLYLYHIKTCELFPLLELYHGLKYTGECRCDLHPRFSKDGRYVFLIRFIWVSGLFVI